MSPVWMVSAGASGMRLTSSMVRIRVPETSGFASLLKPMWVSLICRNSGRPAALLGAVAACARSTGTSTPLARVKSVPALP